MWINPNNHQVYSTHSEIRSAFPNVSFSTEMTNDDIAAVGVLPLRQTAQPNINPFAERTEPAMPELIDDEWVQDWDVFTLSDDEQAAAYAALVPTEISALAGLAVIDEADLADAYTAWAMSPDRTFLERAFIDKAATWKRNNAALLTAADALGLTSAQMDAMFMRAKELEPVL